MLTIENRKHLALDARNHGARGFAVAIYAHMGMVIRNALKVKTNFATTNFILQPEI